MVAYGCAVVNDPPPAGKVSTSLLGIGMPATSLARTVTTHAAPPGPIVILTRQRVPGSGDVNAEAARLSAAVPASGAQSCFSSVAGSRAMPNISAVAPRLIFRYAMTTRPPYRRSCDG